MKKLIQASTFFFSAMILATSCSTLPEDPRTWETIDYKKQNQVIDSSPKPTKFHNVFDEGGGNGPTTPGTGGNTGSGVSTHGN